MVNSDQQLPAPSQWTLRHAEDRGELTACFPLIRELRPALAHAQAWCDRALAMSLAGYRVLAVWDVDMPCALAGYRIGENLIHGRFLYVDDLVTTNARRGEGMGAALLQEMSAIAVRSGCDRLVLDTAASNLAAQRFYRREGLLGVAMGFIKPLSPVA